MNMKSMKVGFSVIALALLSACGGESDEAKKLGFASVEEMKEIQAKGWHTKERYEEDEAKRQGYKSVAEMRSVLAKQKELEVKEKIAAEQKAKQREKYTKNKNDIGLGCKYADGSGYEVLIFSEKYSIGLFGGLNKAGDFDPSYSVKKISESNIEIRFSFVNEVVAKITGNRAAFAGEIQLNRETLGMKKITTSDGIQDVTRFNCSILDNGEFIDYVAQVIDARDSQEKRNKI